MSELNNNILEQNNDQLFLDFIKNGSNDEKVDFIKNVAAHTDIPVHFVRIKNGLCGDKIFYKWIDGERYRREWLLFQNNRFFCVYCFCFSQLNSKKPNQFIEGVEYATKCRISDKLSRHENESHHALAKSTYLRLNEGCISDEGVQKRNVIKIILKIIIYIATHGK